MLRLYYDSTLIECGVDEAGRGCLAGSVFAAAVILPTGETLREKSQQDSDATQLLSLLNDSKQLSDKQRRLLRPIIEKTALSFAVAEVNNQEIDQINILQASILAMNRAINKLTIRPQLLLVDGNRFHTDSKIDFKTIVKGDATFMSIAAASILAKTYRDDAMINLSKQYPEYKWQENKGYPTKSHRQAIKQFGPSPFHRLTFRLLDDPTLF